MIPAAPRFLSAPLSDPGHVRGNNEDRVFADDARGFFFVVDGMGGHAAGETAAEIAVERIKGRLERQTGTAEQRIREAIALANNAIFEKAQTKSEWHGMACVLTLAVLENSHATIGHVGDSRLYKIRGGRIVKVTHDHSPVGEREDAGELSELDAMRHPRRNEVYRDVGSQEHTPDDEDFIEILNIPFEPDSALLLCSDGLSDVISSGGILKIIEDHAGDRWAAVRALIAAANEDSKDNVSAILIEGSEFAASYGRRSAAQPSRRIAADGRVGEDTERLVAEHPRTLSPWVRGIYLLYGVAVGALLTVAMQRYLPKPPQPHVPQTIVADPQSTIAAALAKAQSGDSVNVPPGIYRETIQLKDGVDLIAQKPRESVIEGGIVSDGAHAGRVAGFRIRAEKIGIDLRDSDVQVGQCEVSGAREAGVRFSGNSRGLLIASLIHDNPGAGVVVNGASSAQLENNVIASNGTERGALHPGLLIRSSMKVSAVGNVFKDNGAEAIWLPSGDEAIVQRNYFIPPPKPEGRRPAEARKPFRIIAPGEGQP